MTQAYVALITEGPLTLLERSVLSAIRAVYGVENVKICEGLARTSALNEPPVHVAVVYSGMNEEHVEDVLDLFYENEDVKKILVVDSKQLLREIEAQDFSHDAVLFTDGGDLKMSIVNTFGYTPNEADRALDLSNVDMGNPEILLPAEKNVQPGQWAQYASNLPLTELIARRDIRRQHQLANAG